MSPTGWLKPRVRRTYWGSWTVSWPSPRSGTYIRTCGSWDHAIETALTVQPPVTWTQR